MLFLFRKSSLWLGVSCLLLSAWGLASPASAQRKGKAPTPQEARKAKEQSRQLQGKVRNLKSRMRNVREKIHVAAVKEHRIEETLESVQARIARTRGRLGQCRARLRELDHQHDETVQRLHETEERLKTRRRILAQRLRDNYQRGQTTYAHVMLQSRSLNEMLSRGHYVQLIVKSDAELIEGVKADIRQIEQDKKRLEAQAREQQSLADELEQRKDQLAADLQTQRTMLAEAHAQKESAENELDDLEEESNAMTARIRQLSEIVRRRIQADREEARRRRLQQQASRPKPTPSAPRSRRRARSEDSEDTPHYVGSGQFLRPVNGRVTSGYGYRYHPILKRRKLHTGIDFGVPYGTPIKAADSGVVILASYNRGYGNCVIIDHGNGYQTLYGHCSSLVVGEGQTVSKGQLIAYVGSTGMSTGPHLHWEVRRNGSPISPW